MCLAIISPTPDKRPDTAGLKIAFGANNGGAGFAYLCTRRKRVIVRKGFMRYQEFDTEYRRALAKARGPMLVHFRIPTHGSTAPSMTHPFRLPEVGAALIHNGMINLSDKDRPHLSDTALFCERVRGYTAARFNAERADLEKRIGWSKIAVLYPDAEIVTLGTGWHTNAVDGCTYSNRSYQPFASMWEADPREWGGKARKAAKAVKGAYRSATAPLRGADDDDYDYARFMGRTTRAPFQSVGRADRLPGPVREYRFDPASGLLEPVPARVVRAGHTCDLCRTRGGLCDPDGSGRLCDGGLA